jgi:putative two-component system response regulator
MSRYSELLAQLYGLSDEECELILYAAPLHDIGKVGIPDKVLLKPGRFTPDEFEVMKKHSLIGAAMLEGAQELPILNAGHIIALQHHEKWDGTGYPHGKKGEEIHLYARIVAIADVFDALNSKRCYKDSIPMEKVIEIIKEGASNHFDPELVEIFLQNVEQFIAIAKQCKIDHSLDETMNLIEQVR